MQGKSLVMLLVVLYASAFLAGFNENLVNMALMSIMGEYGVDSVAAQWLVTGYMIVATIVVMCMAFMYRRFKLRPLYFAAAAFTLIGSVMGLFATSFELLMAARLVQAAGSGIFIPLMMNTVLVVAPKHKLGTFLAIGGCVITFGPALAPTVCGALVTSFGWHSVFAVPLAAMAVLALVALLVVKNMGFSPAHLDIPSTVLSAAFLCALSLGLVELTIDVPLAVGSLAAAAVLLVSFATSESEPLPTVANVPEVTWTASAAPLEDGDAAIACAKRFFESAFIHENTDEYAFTAALVDGNWRVEARLSLDSLPIVMRFSQEGYVLEYDGTRALNGLSFTDTSYTHRTLTDSVDQYIQAFMSALVPGAEWASAGATADVRAGEVRLVDVAMRDEEGRPAYQLTLQVEPTARVLYYLAETAG